MDAEKLRVARDKLTRVFRYLKHKPHRNPAKSDARATWSMGAAGFFPSMLRFNEAAAR